MSEARRLKSRAGCIQCKRRKVKCDQGLPGCQQCFRQKLKCPGYQKPLKWIDTSEESKATVHPASNKNLFGRPGNSGNGHIYFSSAFKENLVRVQSPGLPMPLNDESSILIQHYFTRVCKIAGCFDSDISPFRIIPATMMSYSKPVFLLLQASSAAQLSRRDPKMRYKALSLQSEAFSAVRTEIASLRGSIVSDELMLSCIIAGLTSSWYDVNDIGSGHVLGSQVLLSLWLASKSGRIKYHETFILGAYVYWLAISAFVTGDPKSSFHFQEALQQTLCNMKMGHDIVDATEVPDSYRRIFPHPLTGFSMQTVICVGKVGSLCRVAHNETVQSLQTFPLIGSDRQENLEKKARAVEQELLGLLQTRQPNFQDPQDSQTTVDEILIVGEAYRCAGLLQLYMTFPRLLQEQLLHLSHKENNGWEENLLFELYTQEVTSGNGFTPPQHNWLRGLAFHILSLLETVPPTSGTRVLQGLPVLIAATWLVDSINDGVAAQTPLQHPRLPLKKSSKSKEDWREIVRDGLRMHAEYVGLQQVSRILEIVEEVWRRDDEGKGKCHWIVVVASMGLQTLYG